MTGEASFSTRAFRNVLGMFATGVTVVSADAAPLGPIGLTVNSLTSVSLDPPLILWCVDRHSITHDSFLAAPSFSVHILAEGQADRSARFADRTRHGLKPGEFEPGPLGAPLLPGALGVLHCRPEAHYPGGDHTILVGRVAALAQADGAPLLYYRGGYRRIDPDLTRVL